LSLDEIPNPSTQAWLRSLWNRSPEWSACLAWEIYEGTLTDEGDGTEVSPCGATFEAAPLPARPKAARRQQSLLDVPEDAGRMGGKYAK
jgi:hypothetical protein